MKKTLGRVGILRNTFLPLSETFIFEQIQHIKGFEISVFTRCYYNQNNFPFNGVHSIIDKKSFVEYLDYITYTFLRRSNTFVNILKREPVHLLHAHFGIDGVYTLPLKKKFKIPLVVTFHGHDITRLPKFSLKRPALFNYYLYFDELIKKGDLFIAVSNFIKEKLIEKGFPKDKIKVIYIGISLDKFPYILRKTSKKPVIITIGRLVEKKGTRFLIEAFSKLTSRFPETKLKIIGDGPLSKSLKKLVEKHKLQNKVYFLGKVPYNIVKRELLRSDIFCLPSVCAKDGDEEGLGMVLLEAAATGLPIVGTNSGGIPEAVVNGETGFLVREKDTIALEEKLCFLLKDPQLRIEMGKRGREFVEEKFDIVKQTKKLEELYKELIS